ncbi:MAG: sulfite exporter TauE/SafE family protein [Akkermansiaceae bacterium]|nr:sulfite exporter TauE/SafE family protein [Akkermansiaceae bacterium]
MKLALAGIVIGVLAGLAGALCGVGGGIVMVPAFALILGMEQKQAVATSLAIVMVTALMGTLNQVTSKSGLIDWRLFLVTAAGAGVAAWFGTDLMRALGNQALTRVFGVLLVLVGLRMLFLRVSG